MNAQEVIRAWGRILQGRRPSLSIEITRECPLRCPGCYAYEPGHPGEGLNLRQLSDYKGGDLVLRVLALVDKLRPLHLSIVGGDPLVRYRELEAILPQLAVRGIHTQVVTSAFREIPASWAQFPRLYLVVSIDGLQPEHDLRRRPATYDRILKNISGHRVTVHCTVTAQMMQRRGYLQDFLDFWTPRPEIKKVWFSIFTPQTGATGPEILSLIERRQAVEEMLRLQKLYPKLDMTEGMIREFMAPPASPGECIFARTTDVISADLKSHVAPCQFGGNPDCSQCGCVASMGMAAVGHYKLAGLIRLGSIYKASSALGNRVREFRTKSAGRDIRETASAPQPQNANESAPLA
ncbi:MAG TPA: radical SAM protein [Candidatus Acidoferrales bacterium]|nr:radical SAM protein [Candidatus Acidoferrales bacterium]